jgi:hypothetical protein
MATATDTRSTTGSKATLRPAKRLKARYVAALVIVLLSVLATPHAIEHAYQQRGYLAYGEEYLLIPFGLMLAMFALSIASDIDKARRKFRDDDMQSLKKKE